MKRFRKWPALLALVVVGLSAVQAAHAVRDVPFLTGPVMDLAGMIPDTTQNQLEARIRAFERETGAQVQVLVVPDLDGEPVEDFSIRVVDAWQLGRGEQDNGVLFLIAKAERRMRIEVGYGLEDSLTDAKSRRILDNVVTPRFRAGDIGGGVSAGVETLFSVIRGEDTSAPYDPVPTGGAVEVGCGELFLILFFLLLFFLILTIVARRSRSSGSWSSDDGWVFLPGGGSWGSSSGGGWSGGGSWGGGGGGGWSGGGGGFGGGGASGGW